MSFISLPYFCSELPNQRCTSKYRKTITKMRCSSHKFTIEKGTMYKFERNQRSKCNFNDIEDEFYFILRCPA